MSPKRHVQSPAYQERLLDKDRSDRAPPESPRGALTSQGLEGGREAAGSSSLEDNGSPSGHTVQDLALCLAR